MGWGRERERDSREHQAEETGLRRLQSLDAFAATACNSVKEENPYSHEAGLCKSLTSNALSWQWDLNAIHGGERLM